MKFHVFYTDNVPEKIINDHKKCSEKLGVNVEYHSFVFPNERDKACSLHGNFMTSMMEDEIDDVVCFLDLDCLPYNKDLLVKAYNWTKESRCFVGNAQNVSHENLVNRLYAAPSMLMIHKEAWKTLGSPSLKWFIQNDLYIDTAQVLTLRADQIGFHYQLMYPIGCDGDPIYKLGGYGNYGYGTLYPASYHHFTLSTRFDETEHFWDQRVDDILNSRQIIPKHSSIYYGL